MAMAYLVGRIKRHQVDRAYRLIEAVDYPVDLEQWRSFCNRQFNRRFISSSSRDVITVENSLGYIQGVSIAYSGNDAGYGHILDVPVFVVATVSDTAGVSKALMGYLIAMARADNCRYIIVANIDPGVWPDKSPTPRNGVVIPVTL